MPTVARSPHNEANRHATDNGLRHRSRVSLESNGSGNLNDLNVDAVAPPSYPSLENVIDNVPVTVPRTNCPPAPKRQARALWDYNNEEVRFCFVLFCFILFFFHCLYTIHEIRFPLPSSLRSIRQCGSPTHDRNQTISVSKRGQSSKLSMRTTKVRQTLPWYLGISACGTHSGTRSRLVDGQMQRENRHLPLQLCRDPSASFAYMEHCPSRYGDQGSPPTGVCAEVHALQGWRDPLASAWPQVGTAGG